MRSMRTGRSNSSASRDSSLALAKPGSQK